jgi:heme iron utilization protein
LFFVSLLAEHTQNAKRDPRASLLVTEPVPEGADPLASGRATLLGTLHEVTGDDRPAVRDAYLAANPTAAYYIDFADFVFYRLAVEAIRYVGGYGRMSWVTPEAYAAAEADPLAGAPAAGIIAHMNADHAEAQVLFCRHLAGRPDTTAASMSAVDRYGFELIAVGPTGRAALRLGFPEPCTTGEQVRAAMVALVAQARAAAAAAPAP